jgi:hypothetical protein
MRAYRTDQWPEDSAGVGIDLHQAAGCLHRSSYLGPQREIFGKHFFCACERELGAVDALLLIRIRVKVRVRDHGTTSLGWFEPLAGETYPGGVGSVTLRYSLSHVVAGALP